MIIEKVLEKNYGDKVSEKSVNSQFNSVKKQYGAQFASALANNGMTEDTFRDSLRLQALEKEAVKANSKFSNKELKSAYDS